MADKNYGGKSADKGPDVRASVLAALSTTFGQVEDLAKASGTAVAEIFDCIHGDMVEAASLGRGEDYMRELMAQVEAAIAIEKTKAARAALSLQAAQVFGVVRLALLLV